MSTITLPNSVYTLQEPIESLLYPEIMPHEEGMLPVSGTQKIWYAVYGNPKGIPILFVHGGPGAGCTPRDMRFFDPHVYRIVLFDQRGAKRSPPIGGIDENTTQDLLEDMEKLRCHLGITQWILFGGSWGSALSLLYGEAHPERCLGFILRGVFFATQVEAKQLWFGMRDTYPEAWEEMVGFLPENERDDLIEAYSKRLMRCDRAESLAAARALMKYDLICAHLRASAATLEAALEDEDLVLAVARLFAYYDKNHFFIRENQILQELPKITHLPAIIVQGRYDVICRARSAYELHKNWPGSELVFVQEAGHSSFEPGITKALVGATRKIKDVISLK